MTTVLITALIGTSLANNFNEDQLFEKANDACSTHTYGVRFLEDISKIQSMKERDTQEFYFDYCRLKKLLRYSDSSTDGAKAIFEALLDSSARYRAAEENCTSLEGQHASKRDKVVQLVSEAKNVESEKDEYSSPKHRQENPLSYETEWPFSELGKTVFLRYCKERKKCYNYFFCNRARRLDFEEKIFENSTLLESWMMCDTKEVFHHTFAFKYGDTTAVVKNEKWHICSIESGEWSVDRWPCLEDQRNLERDKKIAFHLYCLMRQLYHPYDGRCIILDDEVFYDIMHYHKIPHRQKVLARVQRLNIFTLSDLWNAVTRGDENLVLTIIQVGISLSPSIKTMLIHLAYRHGYIRIAEILLRELDPEG